MQKLQPFYLLRKEDETGISGTGIVAIGVQLPSGHCVIEWTTFCSSINIYRSLSDVIEVHGHHGKTEVVMGEPDEQKPTKRRSRKTN